MNVFIAVEHFLTPITSIVNQSQIKGYNWIFCYKSTRDKNALKILAILWLYYFLKFFGH